jgi:hypothetical protein
MYHTAVTTAGSATDVHLLPERILPMVVHLLAHHPKFVGAQATDAQRNWIAKWDIGSVVGALASGPE